MNIKELYLMYGNQFLSESDLHDDILISMEKLGSSLIGVPYITAFAKGWASYGYFGGSFNFSASNFIIDEAGNYASIEEHQVIRYFNDVIDDRDFLDWLFENNYIAESDYYYLQED